LRRPIESAQYTSFAFQQVLDDHQLLGSIGSVGDAYDNALAESFVDTFKTELITNRVWRARTQLELAIVQWVAWFNNDRLHESLSDRPTGRDRSPLRCPDRSDSLSQSMKRGNHQTRSPRNPARLSHLVQPGCPFSGGVTLCARAA
jgi:putative transposase